MRPPNGLALRLSIPALVSLFVSFVSGQLCAQSLNSAEVAKKLAPAVVLIKGTSDNGEVLGTGFLISSDGKIATNLHVIERMRQGGVQLASGEKFDSFTVLAFDQRKDIAITICGMATLFRFQ